MSSLLTRPFVRVTLGMLLLTGGLAIVQPWTVVPLQAPPPAAFDPASYARDVWPRLLQEAAQTAVDVQAAARASNDGGPRPAVFVEVRGTVTEIDRESRVGFARVRVAEPSSRLAIQVGPVFRGTALRDAASFIRFGDFTNQFEFAAVSNALHDRVLSDVVGHVDLDALPGKTVTVLGATRVPAARTSDSTIDIVPLEIRVAGASP
jgi:predicted lipoprotein